jgi:hypothetical protein
MDPGYVCFQITRYTLRNRWFQSIQSKKTLLYEHVRTFEEKTRTHTKQTNKQHDLGHLSLGIEVTSETVEFPRPGPGEFHYYGLLMKYGTDAL